MRTVSRRTVTREQVELARAYEMRDHDALEPYVDDNGVLTREATDMLLHAWMVIFPDPEEQRLWELAEGLTMEYGI
jgi:hypothetical protein